MTCLRIAYYNLEDAEKYKKKYSNILQKEFTESISIDELTAILRSIDSPETTIVFLFIFKKIVFERNFIDEFRKFKKFVLYLEDIDYLFYIREILLAVPTKISFLTSFIPTLEFEPNSINLSILNEVRTFEGFLKNREKLEKTIFLNLLFNKNNYQFINSLKELRDSFNNRQNLQLELEKNNFDGAIDECRKEIYAITEIFNNYINAASSGFHKPKDICSFFEACTMFKSAKITKIESEEAADASFLCPIALDDTHDPCILLKDGKVTYPKQKKRVYNPYPEVPRIFEKYIDSAISVFSYNESKNLGYPIRTSPLTRNPVMDVFPLGACQNNVDYANQILFKIFSNIKPFVPDLIFAAIWKFFEETKVERFQELTPFVRRQMIFRLNHSLNYVYLHPLTNIMQNKVTLRGSIFFILSSPFFYKDFINAGKPLPARIHESILPMLVELSKLADNPKAIINEKTLNYYQSYFYFNNLSETANGKAKLESLLHSYNGSIPIDMPVTDDFYKNTFKFPAERISLEESVALAKHFLTTKTMLYHFELDAKPYTKVWENENEIESSIAGLEINPETMRPRFSYKDEKRFKVFNIYAKLTKKNKRFPSYEELLSETLKSLKTNGIDCLMTNYEKILHMVIDKYSAITHCCNNDPNEFTKRFNTRVPPKATN